MSKEYTLYADESVSYGDRFSNFYGGCLIGSKDLSSVVGSLNAKKASLQLHGEVKWGKVTAPYLNKYQALVAEFFRFVSTAQVKVRIMFTQNRYAPAGLTADQRDNAYFLLYYQFVKHAFGFEHLDADDGMARIRIYLDSMPDSFEKRRQFRDYLAGLTRSPGFRNKGLVVDSNQIAEVESHDHVLLQCTDIVLGAMQFRLNNKHQEKVHGTNRRGKRTRAKEALYREILAQIQAIYPRFNPGITTGQREGVASRWRDPYRHWLFVSANREDGQRRIQL